MHGTANAVRRSIYTSPDLISAYDTSVLVPARKLYLKADQSIWCIVDADDYEWIIEHSWNWGRCGKATAKRALYAKRNVGENRTTIWLHRAIMQRGCRKPDWWQAGRVVDHINGQSLDNRRRANLRWATRSENARNIVRHPPSLEWIWENLCSDASASTEVPF